MSLFKNKMTSAQLWLDSLKIYILGPPIIMKFFGATPRFWEINEIKFTPEIRYLYIDILSYENIIWTNNKVSYFGFNFIRKSTY